ncbi:MAG: hypothetical protein WCP98_01145 [Actinomycetes bacterium]
MSKIAREKPEAPYIVGVAKYPRLPAYLVNNGTQLRVWCCWCDQWHHHGAGAKDDPEYPLLGSRAAHCGTASPYRRTGYVLTDPKRIERTR